MWKSFLIPDAFLFKKDGTISIVVKSTDEKANTARIYSEDKKLNYICYLKRILTVGLPKRENTLPFRYIWRTESCSI